MQNLNYYKHLKRLMPPTTPLPSPTVKSTLGKLAQLTGKALEAEAEFRRLLHEDSRIADNMRDYWKNQQGGN